MSKGIQKFTVSAVDPKEFVRMVLEFGAKGAWLPDDEYPQINHYPKHVKLAIEVNENTEAILSSPNIIAFDPVYDAKSFTKEELDEMQWDDLKAVCKAVGVTGRDRTVIINRYLAIVGESVEEPKPAKKAAKPKEAKAVEKEQEE